MWIPLPNVSANSRSYWLYLEICPESNYFLSPALVQGCSLLPAYGSGLLPGLPACTSPITVYSQQCSQHEPSNAEDRLCLLLCSEPSKGFHLSVKAKVLPVDFALPAALHGLAPATSLPPDPHPHLRAFAYAVSSAWMPSSYISTGLSPSLPLSFCLDVTFLVRPSLTILYKVAPPCTPPYPLPQLYWVFIELIIILTGLLVVCFLPPDCQLYKDRDPGFALSPASRMMPGTQHSKPSLNIRGIQLSSSSYLSSTVTGLTCITSSHPHHDTLRKVLLSPC